MPRNQMHYTIDLRNMEKLVYSIKFIS